MSSDWREQIEVAFPIIRYHPLIKHRDGVKIKKTRTLLDAPMNPWGSADGSAYLQHGGVGLSRNIEFPSKDTVLPGGIFDAHGRHIPILDIDAPERQPTNFSSFLLETFSLCRTFRYRYSFGEPEQLELDDFKNRLIAFGKEERKMPRTTNSILAAESFYEVMEAECEPAIVKAYYKTVLIKNWLNK